MRNVMEHENTTTWKSYSQTKIEYTFTIVDLVDGCNHIILSHYCDGSLFLYAYRGLLLQRLLINALKSVTAYISHIMDHAVDDLLIIVFFVIILIRFVNSYEQMQKI